jgi:hypothetical protein
MARQRWDTRQRAIQFGYAPDFRPQRAPSIKPRVVPCPDCKAEVGDKCTNAAGEPTSTVHRSRRRMAVRKINEEGTNA